jgi:hypothetical protein
MALSAARCAASDAYSFAIDASSEIRSCTAFEAAAL